MTAVACIADVQLYVNHMSREAWEQENAPNIPDAVKDLRKMELVARPPNYDAHVFCVAMRDCPTFTLDGTTDTVTLERGEVALLPYAPLRPLLAAGDVLLT